MQPDIIQAPGAEIPTEVQPSVENPARTIPPEEISLREATLNYFNGGLIGLNGEPLAEKPKRERLQGFLTESMDIMATEIVKGQTGRPLDTALVGKARLLYILSKNALEPQPTTVQNSQINQPVTA